MTYAEFKRLDIYKTANVVEVFDENGIERKYTNQFVHRLVARAFIPNPDNLPVVNHKDGNKLNNDPSNLVRMSRAEHVREHKPRTKR